MTLCRFVLARFVHLPGPMQVRVAQYAADLSAYGRHRTWHIYLPACTYLSSGWYAHVCFCRHMSFTPIQSIAIHHAVHHPSQSGSYAKLANAYKSRADLYASMADKLKEKSCEHVSEYMNTCISCMWKN